MFHNSNWRYGVTSAPGSEPIGFSFSSRKVSSLVTRRRRRVGTKEEGRDVVPFIKSINHVKLGDVSISAAIRVNCRD